MRQIFFDTETTGLSPTEGHRVIEIGCIEVIDRTITGNHYHCYLNPEREIDAAAIAVHNLTLDKLQHEPKFADIAPAFLDFIKDAELIAHNAPFDIAFLDAELARVDLPALGQTHQITDTLAMARARFPAGRCSLDDLCNRFEVDRSKRQYHGALIDADLLAQVYLAMTRGQETLAIGSQGLLQSMLLQKTGQRPAVHAFACSVEDQDQHQQYMDNLQKTLKDEKALWSIAFPDVPVS